MKYIQATKKEERMKNSRRSKTGVREDILREREKKRGGSSSNQAIWPVWFFPEDKVSLRDGTKKNLTFKAKNNEIYNNKVSHEAAERLTMNIL